MKRILNQLKKEYKLLLAGVGIGPKPTDFIGLDIGSKYFRAVRVRKSGAEFSVQDSFIDTLEELKGLAARMRISDEDTVHLSFGIDNLIIKRISMPVMPHEEITNALRWELKEHLNFDIENSGIRFDILGEKESEDGTKKMELLALAYKEEDIVAKINELRVFGLSIHKVMPLGFGLASFAVNSKAVSGNEKIAIVDIGSIKTTISIIEKDKVYFTREIAIGGDTITNAMTGVLITDKGKVELSWEEAERMKCENGIPSDIKILSMIRPVLERLAGQIRSSLEYCENQFSCTIIRKIILAGKGSKLKGLAEYLTKEAGIEVAAILPETAEAIGLALSIDSDLNMLPEKFKLEKKNSFKRFSIRVLSICMGLVLLFSYGFLYVRAFNLRRGLDIHKQHWDNLKEVKLLKDTIAAYSAVIDKVSSGNASSADIMKELSNLILPDVILDNFIINSKDKFIKISGISLKEVSVTEFMSKLESSALFQNVKLSFSKKDLGHSSDAVSFELSCTIVE